MTSVPRVPAPAQAPQVSGSRRRWRRLPGLEEGWSSLILLVIMMAATGVALDDGRWAGWTADGASATGALPLLMVTATLLGAVLAKTRLGVGWAHVLAATVGAVGVLVAASAAVSADPDLHRRLVELNESLARFVATSIIAGERSSETSALLIVLGAVAWTTGYFGAFNVFRRARAMPAIAACGAILLVALSTSMAPYLALVVVATAALLLHLRLNLLRQQEGWARRHIAGGRGVARLFLGGGLGLVSVALVGAVALAGPLRSAPLSEAWQGLDESVLELATALDNLLGNVADDADLIGGVYPERQRIRDRWPGAGDLEFTAEVPEGRTVYWRGAVYDDYVDGA